MVQPSSKEPNQNLDASKHKFVNHGKRQRQSQSADVIKRLTGMKLTQQNLDDISVDALRERDLKQDRRDDLKMIINAVDKS
ncbi:uncharacterized protein ACN427_009015 isoform 2-T7 [Glossina fuscipes fuscipes]